MTTRNDISFRTLQNELLVALKRVCFLAQHLICLNCNHKHVDFSRLYAHHERKVTSAADASNLRDYLIIFGPLFQQRLSLCLRSVELYACMQSQLEVLMYDDLSFVDREATTPAEIPVMSKGKKSAIYDDDKGATTYEDKSSTLQQFHLTEEETIKQPFSSLRSRNSSSYQVGHIRTRAAFPFIDTAEHQPCSEQSDNLESNLFLKSFNEYDGKFKSQSDLHQVFLYECKNEDSACEVNTTCNERDETSHLMIPDTTADHSFSSSTCNVLRVSENHTSSGELKNGENVDLKNEENIKVKKEENIEVQEDSSIEGIQLIESIKQYINKCKIKINSKKNITNQISKKLRRNQASYAQKRKAEQFPHVEGIEFDPDIFSWVVKVENKERRFSVKKYGWEKSRQYALDWINNWHNSSNKIEGNDEQEKKKNKRFKTQMKSNIEIKVKTEEKEDNFIKKNCTANLTEEKSIEDLHTEVTEEKTTQMYCTSSH